MNWSFPAVVRTFEVLAPREWTITTWSLQALTGSMAPHSDIASVRGLFKDLGYPDWQESVRSVHAGWSGEEGDPSRRKVYRYWVPEEWRGRCRRVLRYARDHGTRRPALAVLARICEAEGQLALF